MPDPYATAATVTTMLWLATMSWFDHSAFLLRLVLGVIVTVSAFAGMAMVQPARRELP